MLGSLAHVSEQLHRRYNFVEVATKFSHGMANTYSRAVAACLEAPWCRYMRAPGTSWVLAPRGRDLIAWVAQMVQRGRHRCAG